MDMESRVYFDAQGQIKEVAVMPVDFFGLNDFSGLDWLVGTAGIDTHYVLNGQVLEKQPLSFTIDKSQITADGIDEVIITGIPAGTTVEWPDGQTDEVTDGEVRFSVDLPGTYTLKFSAIPYLDQEVVIEAVAAA